MSKVTKFIVGPCLSLQGMIDRTIRSDLLSDSDPTFSESMGYVLIPYEKEKYQKWYGTFDFSTKWVEKSLVEEHMFLEYSGTMAVYLDDDLNPVPRPEE